MTLAYHIDFNHHDVGLGLSLIGRVLGGQSWVGCQCLQYYFRLDCFRLQVHIESIISEKIFI